MIAALQAAGFVGVEAEGDLIHARLSEDSGEFTLRAAEGQWWLAMAWPVRATAEQLAAWAADHPEAWLDLWRGETRLRMRIAPGDLAALARWAELAEEARIACLRWRRAQRAPGEGM